MPAQRGYPQKTILCQVGKTVANIKIRMQLPREGADMGFRRETLFIVGAGASCELGFPSGPKLLGNIATSLDVRFDYTQQISGSHEVMSAYRRHHGTNTPDENINDYLHAGWRLRDAAKIARSIDNAIDQNLDDPKVPLVGKFAIAHEILHAERKSAIFTSAGSQPAPVDRAQKSWLHPLAQMLTTGVRRSDVEMVFENFAIITFNYDRSIEHYLPSALQAAYGLPEPEAQAVVAKLRIHHAYGQVGALPWLPKGQASIEYGADPGTRLELVAAGLATFAESREPDEELAQMHALMADAQQIVFLGFGYHRQNMELLRPVGGVFAERIIGTVFMESPPAQETAHQAMRNLFTNLHLLESARFELANQECGSFLSDRFSQLTA